ncbi:hypothetical protein NIES4071_83710 [Calothrix sp. NIES-4071]|nr:hypothetical protein NIES4071_83710 [Calothrix sp. NIES-4071]BAZ62639.1 hypothetical protein NIES4105_83640 [Calothrix sp. NIES-4105]
MTCELVFLPVGNADSIVISPNDDSVVVVDLHKIPILLKWLQTKKVTNISRIYITHEHRDHFPSLEDLVTFLDNWLKRGNISTLCLPHEVYKDAKKKVISDRAKYKSLEDALLRLRQWEKKNMIKFIEATRGSNPYLQGALSISILHPGLLYAQDHLATVKGKDNEISVVLRVSYGNFVALLLADIEGTGLKECVEICQPDELSANIVKIPHHGAYPKNGDDLKHLLEKIDAELAVLSVGSTNTYGHVVPELFKVLSNQKDDEFKKLDNFVCTEATRACVNSNKERAAMGKSGLEKAQKCAGEITINAETSGKWDLKTETEHESVISEFKYPACKGKIDFGSISK